jgi:hypothetical protein
MSAKSMLENGVLPEIGKVCQILILCEDFAAYERAVAVCRRGMEQFAGELEFDFKCWNFAELADSVCARNATKAAGTADIILLATNTAELPPVLEGWLAAFPEARFRAGALVLVGNELDIPAAATETLSKRLGRLAGRSGSDFLSQTPSTPSFQDEDWLTIAVQAEDLPRTANDHWGLNE